MATDEKKILTRGERRFLASWAAGLLLAFALATWAGAGLLRGHALETAELRASRLAAIQVPAAKSSSAVEVTTGLRLLGISDFSLQEAYWTAEFEVWFRWKGDALSPGEDFTIVDGEILRREKRKSLLQDGEHYERYYVSAKITRSFDSTRFPFADVGVLIRIEDSAHDAQLLHFVADQRDSGIELGEERFAIRMKQSFLGVAQHAYENRRGDNLRGEQAPEIHSQLVFAALVDPPSASAYQKMFAALLASVALGLAAFFIKPTWGDGRFGMGCGAFFAAVANNVFTRGSLPASGRVSLTDMVNAAGLGTIFLTIVASLISLHIFDTRESPRLSRIFDWLTFAVMLLCFAGFNLALALAAQP